MHLQELLERSKHFFNSSQYVFTGMNGMGHIEKINRYFAPEKVLTGTCLIGTVLKDAGNVDFIGKAGAGSINIAAQSGTIDDVQKQIVTEFEASNLNPNLTDNFLGTLYTKVVFNSVINTICTLFEIRMGQFIDYEGAEKLGRQLIDEAYNYLRLSQDDEKAKELDLRPGMGLAFCQLGVLKRIFIISYKNEDGEFTE